MWLQVAIGVTVAAFILGGLAFFVIVGIPFLGAMRHLYKEDERVFGKNRATAHPRPQAASPSVPAAR
jgi:hypothetical protein